MEIVTDFIFFGGGGSKINALTAGMKLKSLLLGRKVMSNLDSLLKCRDITVPTNVRLVKAIVYPVVMYGCESLTIENSEY